MIHLVKDCGGKFGFVSSHATNSFALVVFLSLLLKIFYKWLPPVLLFWGILIAYSRVYLGVHYPGDVLGGAVLGASIGWFVFLAYRYIENRVYSD
jgi:undecaprenyl-diphosphatase